MKTSKRVSDKRKALIILVVLAVVSSACVGDGDNKNDTVTPTPINVGSDVANEIIDDTIEVVEEVNTTLVIIREINCRLEFDSCNEVVKDLDDVIAPE